jgi:hypothetical protein
VVAKDSNVKIVHCLTSWKKWPSGWMNGCGRKYIVLGLFYMHVISLPALGLWGRLS